MSGALRKIDDLALRRETKTSSGYISSFVCSRTHPGWSSSPVCRATGEPSDIAYPRSAQLPACTPVGGNPQLGNLHLRRSDRFRYVAFRADQSSAAISTRSASALRYNHRTSGNHAVVRVDNPQRSVAIFDGCDDYAERDDIGKLPGSTFLLHLPPDGHRPLRPTCSSIRDPPYQDTVHLA